MNKKGGYGYKAINVMEYKKILFVDDEEKIRIMFRNYLSKKGYNVMTANNGEEALYLFNKEKDFDLVILDVMMPIKDGYETCAEIKKISKVPVIMLTAKDAEDDEIEGLKCGADDYISKLSSLKLINTRIELILNRYATDEREVIDAGGIHIDLITHIITVDGKALDLSLKEFDLLTYLVKNKNKALTREQLLKDVWNYDYFDDSRTLDTHIKKLRKHFKDKDYIKTIWGVGYKFEV